MLRADPSRAYPALSRAHGRYGASNAAPRRGGPSTDRHRGWRGAGSPGRTGLLHWGWNRYAFPHRARPWGLVLRLRRRGTSQMGGCRFSRRATRPAVPTPQSGRSGHHCPAQRAAAHPPSAGHPGNRQCRSGFTGPVQHVLNTMLTLPAPPVGRCGPRCGRGRSGRTPPQSRPRTAPP